MLLATNLAYEELCVQGCGCIFFLLWPANSNVLKLCPQLLLGDRQVYAKTKFIEINHLYSETFSEATRVAYLLFTIMFLKSTQWIMAHLTMLPCSHHKLLQNQLAHRWALFWTPNRLLEVVVCSFLAIRITLLIARLVVNVLKSGSWIKRDTHVNSYICGNMN